MTGRISWRDDSHVACKGSFLAILLPAVKRMAIDLKNGGDDETRTRDLCRDSLGIDVLSATYILARATKSLKGTVGTVRCG